MKHSDKAGRENREKPLLSRLRNYFLPRKALSVMKFIGPGFLVTIGFIDPGNWATNVAAGSFFGYSLLWVITLATGMLIILQHNAAHLGIVTGYCLSEAATFFLPAWFSRTILVTAMIAAVSTALAEILGSAIALNMLFGLPIKLGALLSAVLVAWLLENNSYRKIEKLIIGFVSLIGISFLIELGFVHIHWNEAVVSWVKPSLPQNSLLAVMSLLGAVVMPHNMFLHSEFIQSRQCNLESDAAKTRRLKYEFLDTSFAMVIGWAINSAMILVAASTFFNHGIQVTDLSQAEQMLRPLLGNTAAIIFALALLFSGISAAITAGMAGGSIYAGIFGKPYDVKDKTSRFGSLLTIIPAALVVLVIRDTFQGLIYSQLALGIQLPFTIFLQIYMTSSHRLMGKFANSTPDKILLWTIGLVVTGLNIALLVMTVKPAV